MSCLAFHHPIRTCTSIFEMIVSFFSSLSLPSFSLSLSLPLHLNQFYLSFISFFYFDAPRLLFFFWVCMHMPNLINERIDQGMFDIHKRFISKSCVFFSFHFIFYFLNRSMKKILFSRATCNSIYLRLEMSLL